MVIKTNVSEFEGVLTQVTVYSSMWNLRTTLDLANPALTWT